VKPQFRYWNLWLLIFVMAWLTILFFNFDEPLTLISRNALFIPVGFGAAILGNISAVGGGIIFIPTMMFIFHLAPVLSLKVALGSQAFGMTSGAIAWVKERDLPSGVFKITVPGLLLGSCISSLVIHPRAIFIKGLFGPVSIGLGLLTLILIRKNRDQKPIAYREIAKKSAVPLFLVALIGGLITGWIAIGEGELISALLMLGYGMDTSVCIGVGVVLLSVNSLFLTCIHHFLLEGGIPWEIVIFTGLGCVFGARCSVYISRWTSAKTLKIIFALIAMSDGVLFMFQFFSK
jgi:uncharacterized membrane protein YfcA